MKYIKTLTFYKKLLLSYFAIMLLFLISMLILFYNITFKSLLHLYQNNLSAIVKQKTHIIDNDFSEIMQIANSMITDRAFFETLETIDDSPSSLIGSDRIISDIFNKYSLSSRANFQIMLATDRFVFGEQSSSVPISNYKNSELLEYIQSKQLSSCWFPSYEIPKAFHLNHDYSSLNEEYYFTYAQQLNLSAASIYYNGYPQNYNECLNHPTLLLSLHTNYFKEKLEKAIPVPGTFYFVLDADNKFMYHSNSELIGSTNNYEPKHGDSDIYVFQNNNKKYLLCYDKLDTTGWILCSAIPYEQIGLEILSNVWHKLSIILFIFIVCFSIFAFVISRLLSKPIYLLSNAIKSTGDGDFDTFIQYTPKDEFSSIITNFNDMNFKIKKLIETNYETTLRKQEAELSALHFQLNPHFLHNTLNIINLMVLTGETKLCSTTIVKLSQMLKYTTDTEISKVPLHQDIEWLSNYFYITQVRFGERISTEIKIHPALNNCLVPKLFLQPFIENSIIHGFKDKTQDCSLQITGFLFNDKCVFEVTDNGCGIAPDILEKIEKYPEKNIGISNVKQRLNLLYPDHSSVDIHSESNNGTHILISFPYEEYSSDLY